VGLIGGGKVPMPGRVLLAYHGLFFLDELPEFRRHVLDVLRQLLENGITRIQSRGHRRSCGANENNHELADEVVVWQRQSGYS
jgi:predicted ATPase with chaperone activity